MTTETLNNAFSITAIGRTLDLIIGIDPGINGGIAILTFQGAIVDLFPMPETEQETIEVLGEFGPRTAAIALERVQAMPRGKAGNVPMFKLGRSYGFLRGVIATMQIRSEDISPQTWQKGLGIPTRGDKTQGQHKAGLRQKAQSLWPKQKITNKTADSLLIAEYLRRTLK